MRSPMGLPLGSRVGSYEIIGSLGAGGMGEVYRARDTKLDRDVALKLLPEVFATDPDRLARFEREAKTLAALNHPHIAQIYGFEQSGPTSALAMELVEGEDLSQRIARGPIPLDEAVPIAQQIAEALDAAHEQGIIHRDLKPANIKLRADGTVKVLDFGLAKLGAMGAGGAGGAGGAVPLNSPTITSPAVTAAGLIVGTAAYMSPEQARGKPVDKRADIWAFGVVLFEMLAGRRPLDGETMTDILGAIVKSEPDWKALPAATPAAILRLLQRTLEKDPRRRLADIRDARFELDDTRDASDAPIAVTAVRRQLRSWIALLLAVMSIAAIGTWVWIGSRTQAPARDPATWIAAMLALDVPDLGALTDRFAVAPDGSALVIVGPGGGLSLRRRTALDATPIPGVPAGAFSPVFSPDGKWIAFATDGALMKIPTEGGTPAIITRGADYFINLTWGKDDRIRFPSGSWDAVRAVSSAGGSVESIAFQPGVRVRRAEGLSGGRLLVSLAKGSAMSIVVREADGTERVIAEGWDARLTATGHLLYARPEGTTWSLVATPFNKRTASLEGDPVVIARDIAVHYAASAGVTPAGDVFFIAGKARSDRRVVVLNRAGGERDVALPPGAWVAVAPSPDAQMLAIGRWEGARRTIWTVSLATGALTKVTYAEDTFQPRWMPDGKRLLFTHFPLSSQATATSMWSVSTDGRGQIEAISSELDAYPMSVTSDGRMLYYRVYRANQEQSDIYALALDTPNAAPVAVLTTPSSEDWPIPSPNRRWLAYATNASGAEETRVARLDALSEVVQVSARGGRPMSWSPDGGRLYYTDGDTIAVVDVNSSGPMLASRRVAFQLPRDRSGHPAVMPDGEHAVVIRGGSIYSDLVTVQGALTPR